MKSKNINHSINGYIKKPQRDSAPKLHQLFNKDSAPFQIPTARELIIEKLTWFKWFAKEYGDTEICVPFDEDSESQELCKLINVDWQDLDVSVIDEYLANKQQRCLNGERLTFKDFKLKS
jgi:hypothetical protein